MNRKQLKINQSGKVGLQNNCCEGKTPSAPRCKVGDLAILTRSAHPENIGLIVEVVRLTKFDDEGALWHVISRGRPIRLVYLDDSSDAGYKQESKHTPDSALMPITGIALDESAEETDVRIAEAEMLGFASLVKPAKSVHPTNARLLC